MPMHVSLDELKDTCALLMADANQQRYGTMLEKSYREAVDGVLKLIKTIEDFQKAQD